MVQIGEIFLQSGRRHLCFFCLYSPKNSTRKGSENDSDLYSELQNDISKYTALGQIILMGDFNARQGSLDDTVGPCNLPFFDSEDESLSTDADVSFP